MFERLGDIFTFQAPTYREVAEDPTATRQGATIVIIVAVISGIFQQLLFPAKDYSSSTRLMLFGVVLIASLLSWLISGWLLAWVSTGWFEGNTDTSKMLRVTGFVSIFSLLSLIPCVGNLLALLLGFIGTVTGVKEAAAVTTGKAIGISLITSLILAALIIGILFCGTAGVVWSGVR